MTSTPFASTIIPISKLLGNYNVIALIELFRLIIPISKLLGNYNPGATHSAVTLIIPISKLLGNYNSYRMLMGTSILYQYLNC